MTDNEKAEQKLTVAVGRLSELIKSMERLWQRSLSETTSNGKVDLYLVDTDVVMMYMCPGALHNYGALLRYDNVARGTPDEDLSDLETQTVEFIGKLLFFQLNPGVPVGILPSHSLELERQLQEIGDRLITEMLDWETVALALQKNAQDVYETSRARLLDAELAVSAEATLNQESVSHVSELLNRISESLRGHGPLGKLFRFDTLVNAGRLMHVDRLALRNATGDVSYLPVPEKVDGTAIEPVSVLERRLNQKMTALQGGKKRRPTLEGGVQRSSRHGRNLNIESDAKALAQLAWLNDYLDEANYQVPYGGDTRGVGKLLLISGSQLIPRALDELELTSLQMVTFSPLALLGHHQMDEYVRGSAPESTPSSSQALESSLMINFLDSMQQSLNRAADGGVLHDIVHTLDQARRDHLHMIESWKARQLLRRDGAGDPVSEALESLELAGSSFDKLHEHLRELSVKAWQKFARAVAFLNYKNVDRRGVQRNIPPVKFDLYPEAHEQSLALRALAFQEGESELDGPLNIHKLKVEDASHYTEFMCYGLWSLGHRMLRGAQGCVEMALSIAERDGDQRLTERCEALFVRAHLIKLRADAASDLVHAAQCIGQIYALGGPRPVDDGSEHLPENDIRYVSEAFSIACHEYYFSTLCHPAPVESGTLLTLFRKGLALLPGLPDCTELALRDYTSEYVRQQVLGNLVQLALMCKFVPSPHFEDGPFRVYMPVQPAAELTFIEEQIVPLVRSLVEVCEFLWRDVPNTTLPKASFLSVSIAAIAAGVWLNRNDLGHWFTSTGAEWTVIDRQRVRYLEAVRQRQR